MFYSQNEKSSTSKQKLEVSVAEGIAIVALVGVAVFYTKQAQIRAFYFENFEEIWGLVSLVVATLVGLAIWQITKRTKELTKRMRQLTAFSHARNGILVGQTTDGMTLYIPESARTGHVQIVGATGRGKTESVILPWICRDLKQSRSVILIDGKGDPSLVDEVRRYLSEIGKQAQVQYFDLGNESRSWVTNPLAQGTPQQITDRIFASFDFEDPFYRAVQFDIAGAVIALIQEVESDFVTFTTLHEFLTNDAVLSEAVGKSKDMRLVAKLTRFLSERRSDRDQKLAGLVSQIAPFAVGEVAHLVNGPRSDEEQERYLSISDIVARSEGDEPKFVAILIPTLKYQAIGHQLGRLLLQELGWAVGVRSSNPESSKTLLPVFLDEFSAFVYPGFENILNKARSSRVPLHLSHQSHADLERISPAFAKSVHTNTNVKCLLGLNDPETADFFAKHLGTFTTEKETERAKETGWFKNRERTGDISIRQVEEYRIHPNRLKNYTCGWGVLHLPTREGSLTEEIQFARLNPKDAYRWEEKQ
jgi:type IV secretory pathway TraG/TraD family ATPase VirD4